MPDVTRPVPVWAFVDETGDVGQAPGSSRYLIVAAVLAHDPRPLRKAVVKTRKYLHKKLKNIPELKAKRTPKKVVSRLLRYIAELDVAIVIVVLDKHAAPVTPDPEEQYRQVCAAVVRHCIERHAKLRLALDQRYTHETLRERLEDSIFAQAIGGPDATGVRMIRIGHLNSTQEKGIQAADAVAWSVGQKYERGDDELYTIIAHKIIVEEMLAK